MAGVDGAVLAALKVGQRLHIARGDGQEGLHFQTEAGVQLAPLSDPSVAARFPHSKVIVRALKREAGTGNIQQLQVRVYRSDDAPGRVCMGGGKAWAWCEGHSVGFVQHGGAVTDACPGWTLPAGSSTAAGASTAAAAAAPVGATAAATHQAGGAAAAAAAGARGASSSSTPAAAGAGPAAGAGGGGGGGGGDGSSGDGIAAADEAEYKLRREQYLALGGWAVRGVVLSAVGSQGCCAVEGVLTRIGRYGNNVL